MNRQEVSVYMDLDRVERAVSAAQHGDAVALDYLYVRFADDVRSHVMSIVKTQHEAERVTQSVFVQLRDEIRLYERGELSFDRWLLRMARGTALAHRRALRQLPTPDVHPEEEADDSADERRELIRRVFGGLSEEEREVIVLSHALGLSATEIAERLGRTESEVDELHESGCRALGRALEEAGARRPALRLTVES
jgi:RNA polymerase sigma factor (sigma-70 family)